MTTPSPHRVERPLRARGRSRDGHRTVRPVVPLPCSSLRKDRAGRRPEPDEEPDETSWGLVLPVLVVATIVLALMLVAAGAGGQEVPADLVARVLPVF